MICPTTGKTCESSGWRPLFKSCQINTPYTPMGWRCPNCGAGCAPGASVCSNCAPIPPVTCGAKHDDP